MPLPDFGSLTDAYARHRTGYSDALFRKVLAAAPAKPRVLDLGAGTGLSTAPLLPHARSLVAADVARPMLARNPAASRALARAEALPFRTGAFDLVAVAQSYHWFDPAPALAEMRRVLAPGGVAAVWWKYPRAGEPTTEAADRAIESATGRPAAHTPLARDFGRPLPGAPGPFAAVEEHRSVHEVEYDLDGYVGYQSSREILRRAAGPERERALAALRRAVAALHPEGRFRLPLDERLLVLRV